MSKKLYVGNLPYSVNQQTLQDTFSKCGTVESANVIMDRDTGQSKGFAFVEMSSSGEAQKAIQKINGSSLDGRAITVNEAKPQQKRSGGGGGKTLVSLSLNHNDPLTSCTTQLRAGGLDPLHVNTHDG